MGEQHPADYIVLGLDIIKYSGKSLLNQKLAQERIDRCLGGALDEKWTGSEPSWLDAGDGGYLMLQGSELGVLEVLKAFYQRIDRENIADRPENVYVRAAINKDRAMAWTSRIGNIAVNKFTGHAINNCARLMAGMIKDHYRQVICSRPVLDSLMLVDHVVSPTRLKDIRDKHDQSHEVWNIQIDPVLGVKPLEKELYLDGFLRVYPNKKG